VRVAVVSDDATAAAALDRYVVPWLPRAAIDGTAADRRVQVLRAAGGAKLDVLIDDAVVATVLDPPAAVAIVQRAIDETFVQRQGSVAVVHSGVVAHANRAILVPGPTGAGKSTLVAELVRQGAAYLSDEYALIDGDGRVHPYPRPLLLRDGSRTGRPVLASELGGTVAREPMPASLVLELRYDGGAALELETVSQGEAVLLLLRNTPQVLADQPWILAPLQRAAERVACYTGLRGEARESASTILRLAAAREP
jgi:hypothetical protein